MKTTYHNEVAYWVEEFDELFNSKKGYQLVFSMEEFSENFSVNDPIDIAIWAASSPRFIPEQEWYTFDGDNLKTCNDYEANAIMCEWLNTNYAFDELPNSMVDMLMKSTGVWQDEAIETACHRLDKVDHTKKWSIEFEAVAPERFRGFFDKVVEEFAMLGDSEELL